jgi:hypothetical protein
MQLLILYAPADSQALAERLHKDLAAIPRLDPHLADSTAAKLHEQIRDADLILPIISPAALLPSEETSAVMVALDLAQGEFKALLPILSGGVKQVPAALTGIHHLDFNQNLESNLRKLQAEMRNRVGFADTVTMPLNPRKVDALDLGDIPQQTPEAPLILWILGGLLAGAGMLGLLVLLSSAL